MDVPHTQQLPIEMHAPLTTEEVNGVKVLVFMSSISLTAGVLLLIIIFVAAIQAACDKSSRNVFRSHVTAYFVSLLFSDVLQAIGSIMNLKWVQDMSVNSGAFCSIQGGFKQAADVRTAFWISAIAIHTFNVLVLGIHIRRIFMYLVLVGGWSFIGAIATMGPFILQKPSKGPFFAITGYWCWISASYKTEQIVLDYMIMFLSAAISFVLYVLAFLKLRGNLLILPGPRIRLRSMDVSENHDPSDLHAYMASVAKHMLLYPVRREINSLKQPMLTQISIQTLYIVMILPIAACRFAEWTGHRVPVGAVIFSDCIFLLSGFVNALVFVLTGRVLPLKEIMLLFRASSFRAGGRHAKVRASIPGVEQSDCGIAVSDTVSSQPDKIICAFGKELPQLPEERSSQCTPSRERGDSIVSASETTKLV